MYIQWENALEKLKILNYEVGFCKGQGRKVKPFSRIHFIYPAGNPAQQFDNFIDICSWLCNEISQESSLFHRETYDDPNTISNKLMLALRSLDFKGSFPAQKLKLAHGEAVCTVLEFLTDKALTAKGFKWGVPVYSNVAEVLVY